MSDTEFAEEGDLTVSELKPVKQGQLGPGHSKTVDTSKLRKCSITTSVRDVRHGYFVDGEDPSKRHAATVVVLAFEFGSQKRDSWKPWAGISNVKIQLSVDEADDSTVAEKAPEYEWDEPEIRIVAVYPRSARGPVSEATVTRTASANIVSASNVSGGLSVSQTYTVENSVTLRSSPNGTMGTVWTLEENKILKEGVPDVLSCAVLLQTDGLAFELEVEFTAPIMGIKYGGTTTVPIGRKYLKERKARDEWEEECKWEDFASENFKAWIKRKTENAWAETCEYSSRGD